MLLGLGFSTLLLALLQYPSVLAQGGEDVVKKIVSPFTDLLAVLLALGFALGILGFIFLILQGVFKWTVGGGFGRSMAVQTFIRAAETLAIIPVIFFISVVMQNLGDPHIAEVARIYSSMIQRGWDIIISALTA